MKYIFSWPLSVAGKCSLLSTGGKKKSLKKFLFHLSTTISGEFFVLT